MVKNYEKYDDLIIEFGIVFEVDLRVKDYLDIYKIIRHIKKSECYNDINTSYNFIKLVLDNDNLKFTSTYNFKNFLDKIKNLK